MILLALEFSSPVRSVAVLEVLAERALPPRVLGSASDEGEQGTKPFPLIQRSLTAAHVEREAVECIAVGIGPGSYTGIRSAIAIAQGWQLARGVKLLGVSSVETLARQAQHHGWSGRIHIAIDAQRGEFYLTSFEISEGNISASQTLRLATLDEVQKLARSGEILIGPGLSPRLSEARDLCPDAGALGQIAAQRTDFLPGEKLEPIYLRETTFVKAPPPRLVVDS